MCCADYSPSLTKEAGQIEAGGWVAVFLAVIGVDFAGFVIVALYILYICGCARARVCVQI